jgi:hypothetical protein
MSRFFFALLSMTLFFGLAFAQAAPVNCDLNACMTACQKRNPQGGAGNACNSGCQITIADRKKAGQCK